MTDEPRVESESDSVHTLRVNPEDHAYLAEQKVSASHTVRGIFEDYLAGKLEVPADAPVKTTVWVPLTMWDEVVAKAKASGTSVPKVVAAGIAALRARKRRRR